MEAKYKIGHAMKELDELMEQSDRSKISDEEIMNEVMNTIKNESERIKASL